MINNKDKVELFLRIYAKNLKSKIKNEKNNA